MCIGLVISPPLLNFYAMRRCDLEEAARRRGLEEAGRRRPSLEKAGQRRPVLEETGPPKKIAGQQKKYDSIRGVYQGGRLSPAK